MTSIECEECGKEIKGDDYKIDVVDGYKHYYHNSCHSTMEFRRTLEEMEEEACQE